MTMTLSELIALRDQASDHLDALLDQDERSPCHGGTGPYVDLDHWYATIYSIQDIDQKIAILNRGEEC